MSMKMLITDAGLAEVVNAEQSGTAPVVLSHIAFGTGQYTPTADMTALKSEFKRFDGIKGGAIADNVIHISLHDTDKQAYTVYEVGVFTESGTLFAVCSQTTPIVQKAEDAEVMLVTDFVLSDIDVDSITIGDTNFILNPATTEAAGIVELATEDEAKAGTDETRAVTPATLDAAIEAHDNIVHRTGSETIAGAKTFNNNITIESGSPRLNLDQTDITQGTAPATAQSNAISFRDSQNNTMGYMVHEYLTDGENRLRFAAYKPALGSTEHGDLSVVYPAEGTPYATAPTPAAGDNSTKIATTAFVNTKAGNYLPLAGGTLTGTVFTTADGAPVLSAKKGALNGGRVFLCSPDNANYSGGIVLRTFNSDNSVYSDFTLKADGSLTWKDKNLIRSINGKGADSAGNIDVGGMHIGMVFPHPAATPPTGAYLLNGQTITNCRELYPDFWEWVNNSGVRSIGNNTFEAEVAEYGICNGFVLWEQSGSVRLPLWNGYQTPLGDSVPVAGNGMTLGLTDGTNNGGLINKSADSTQRLQFGSNYGDSIGSTLGNTLTTQATLGVTTDPTKSGIVADTSNYKQDGFYWCIQVYNAATELSEQVSAQLASQIQAKAQTDLANVSSVASSFKEQSVGWGIPDYTAGISVTYPNQTTPFVAPSDGVYITNIVVNNAVAILYINGVATGYSQRNANSYRDSTSQYIPLSKGDSIYWNVATPTGMDTSMFYPFKGVN